MDEHAHVVTRHADASLPSEVAAWWPEEWGKTGVTANDERVRARRTIRYGREQFLLVPVATGRSKIILFVEQDDRVG